MDCCESGGLAGLIEKRKATGNDSGTRKGQCCGMVNDFSSIGDSTKHA